MITAEAARVELAKERRKANEKNLHRILNNLDPTVKDAIAKKQGWAELHVGELDEPHSEQLYDALASLGYRVYEYRRGCYHYRYVIVVFDKTDKTFPESAEFKRAPTLPSMEEIEALAAEEMDEREDTTRGYTGVDYD